MRVKHKVLAAAALLMAVTGAASAQGVTQAQALHAILGKCGSGASSVDRDPQGNWHGYCGGARMMVDTQGNAGPDTSVAGAGPISEAQARHAILGKCGSGASTMDRDNNGIWHGYCGGARMMVDAQGNAGPDTTTVVNGQISEAQARHAILGKCGSGASSLNQDAQGNWHGYCGGSRMMVDAQGNAGPDTTR